MSEERMEVFIETLTGVAFELSCSPLETINSIKAKIQYSEGIPVSQQHLIWRSVELDDDLCLQDYSITDGATIKLVLGMRGGPINTRKVKDSKMKDLAEYVERYSDSRCSGVTVLVFHEGDRVRMYTMTDKEGECVLTPFLSNCSSETSSISSAREEEEEVDEVQSRENEAMRAKISHLQEKLKALSVGRPKKPPDDYSLPSNQPCCSKSIPDSPGSFHLPPIDEAKSFDLKPKNQHKLKRVEQPFKIKNHNSQPIRTLDSVSRAISTYMATPPDTSTSCFLPSIASCASVPRPINNVSHAISATSVSDPISISSVPRPINNVSHAISATSVSDPISISSVPRPINNVSHAMSAVSDPISISSVPHSISTSSVHHSISTTSHPINVSSMAPRTSTVSSVPQPVPKPLLKKQRRRRYVIKTDTVVLSPDEVLCPELICEKLGLRGSRTPPERGSRPGTSPGKLLFEGEQGVQDMMNYIFGQSGDITLSSTSFDLGRDSFADDESVSSCIKAVKPISTTASSISAALTEHDYFKVPSKPTEDSKRPSSGKKLPSLKTKKKSYKRCTVCSKKTGLATSYMCRCGKNFCATHRYAETHHCTYDYKAEGKRLLQLHNPLVTASKLPKI